MTFILRAPGSRFGIEQVANLLTHCLEGFYANQGYHTPTVTTAFLQPQDIVYPLRILPEGDDLIIEYERAHAQQMLNRLAPRAAEFGACVIAQGRYGHYQENDRECERNKPQIKVNLIDKTVLQDVMTRQPLPPSQRLIAIQARGPAQMVDSHGGRLYDSITLHNFKHNPLTGRGLCAEDFFNEYLSHQERFLQESQRRLDASPVDAALRLLSA